jgi:hypothetical protein
VVVEPVPPSLRLYGHRIIVPLATLDPALANTLVEGQSQDGNTYLAFRPAREREVAHAAGTPLEILLRTPSLVLARVRMTS